MQYLKMFFRYSFCFIFGLIFFCTNVFYSQPTLMAQTLYLPDANDTAELVSESSSAEKIINEELGEENFSKGRGMSLSLWFPGFLPKMASWFINKEEEPELKSLLKNTGAIRILLKQGIKRNGRFVRKFNRVSKRMKRRGFDKLMEVKSAGADVEISAITDRKGRIRSAAVMVFTEDVFVFVKANGKYDIQQLIEFSKEEANLEF